MIVHCSRTKDGLLHIAVIFLIEFFSKNFHFQNQLKTISDKRNTHEYQNKEYDDSCLISDIHCFKVYHFMLSPALDKWWFSLKIEFEEFHL